MEWGWLLCATSWKRHLWDCTSIYVWPINSMLTTFSAPTQYDIYFFMYGNSSSYCWSEDDCCVQPAEKSLSFICDMCIVHVQRYVLFTVVCREPPPRYPLNIIYTFLPHCFASIRQVGGWYRWSSCVGHKIFLCIWCGVLPLRKYHGTIFNSQQGPIHDI